MPIPTVVTSDYEDENEEINDPESVEDLESISRRAIKKYPSLWGGGSLRTLVAYNHAKLGKFTDFSINS